MNHDALIERARAAGQSHIFAFWDLLPAAERGPLAAQVQTLDFDLLRNLASMLHPSKPDPAGKESERMEPAPVIGLPKNSMELDEMRQARAAGEDALRAGRVGVFLVAGGQGTRLGFDGPKGTFEVGPVSKRSLFQLHAEKILALRRRYGAALPWVIMTSSANDAATREYFEARKYFDLGRESVRFVVQGSLPAFSKDGRLLLETRASLALSPNGHGGSIRALHEAGALPWLRQQKVDTLFYFQVDNALTKICDPVFIGHHVAKKSEMSSKVLRKRDWAEKVGVVIVRGGRTEVIEYSDLADELAKAELPDGSLRFWAGSIAIHVLDLTFVERLNQGGFQLPYHRAEKAVPCIDEKGNPLKLKPGEKNGIKFETFVFDALPLARKTVTLETAREEDFAPIKNADGMDSPATARELLQEQYARWLKAAGHTLPRRPDGKLDCRIEISPLTSLEGEGLEKLAVMVSAPGESVRL